MAKVAPTSLSFPDICTPGREVMDSQKDAMKVLEDKYAQIDFTKPNCDLTGALVRIPHADSYAQYVVIKNSPLTIQHIPFGDAWNAYPATLRGLNRQDILDGLARAKALRDMFSSRR